MLPPNDEYKGVERRITNRKYLLTPAELKRNGLEEIVKVTNLGFGGCRLKCVQLLNVDDSVQIQFFSADETGEDIHNCDEISARVVDVQMGKTEFNVSLAFSIQKDQSQCIDSLMNQF